MHVKYLIPYKLFSYITFYNAQRSVYILHFNICLTTKKSDTKLNFTYQHKEKVSNFMALSFRQNGLDHNVILFGCIVS